MRRSTTGIRGLAWLPVLGGVVLSASLIPVAQWMAPPPRNLEAYRERVAGAIDGVPENIRIGGLVFSGRNQEIARAAQEMLRPNRILQRRYSNVLSGESFNLLITHCGDARDMLGHYPPRCYPNSGWSPRGSDEAEVEFGDRTIETRRYEFSWPHDGGASGLTVYNFFLTPHPDRPMPVDMPGLQQSTARNYRNAGAAQVQVIFARDMAPERQREIIDALAPELEPVLHAVTKGLSS